MTQRPSWKKREGSQHQEGGAGLTEAETREHPNYCTDAQVCKDMKSSNKGWYWSGTISHIHGA
eukprot:3557541-Prorocentrum_lima.AAC.1